MAIKTECTAIQKPFHIENGMVATAKTMKDRKTQNTKILRKSVGGKMAGIGTRRKNALHKYTHIDTSHTQLHIHTSETRPNRKHSTRNQNKINKRFVLR